MIISLPDIRWIAFDNPSVEIYTILANDPFLQTDAWEQRKLGEIADFSRGNGYSKNDLAADGIHIILYGRLYTKYETVIENVDTFTAMKEKSVLSQGGEIIVPSSGETSEDISRASVVPKSGVILGRAFTINY